jgi:hypothetical protein
MILNKQIRIQCLYLCKFIIFLITNRILRDSWKTNVEKLQKDIYVYVILIYEWSPRRSKEKVVFHGPISLLSQTRLLSHPMTAYVSPCRPKVPIFAFLGDFLVTYFHSLLCNTKYKPSSFSC